MSPSVRLTLGTVRGVIFGWFAFLSSPSELHEVEVRIQCQKIANVARHDGCSFAFGDQDH